MGIELVAIVGGLAVFVILFGKLIQWVLEGYFASRFTSREASIAAMSVMLGALPGVVVFDWDLNPLFLAEKVGILVGLVGLWWLLFRRPKSDG